MVEVLGVFSAKPDEDLPLLLCSASPVTAVFATTALASSPSLLRSRFLTGPPEEGGPLLPVCDKGGSLDGNSCGCCGILGKGNNFLDTPRMGFSCLLLLPPCLSLSLYTGEVVTLIADGLILCKGGRSRSGVAMLLRGGGRLWDKTDSLSLPGRGRNAGGINVEEVGVGDLRMRQGGCEMSSPAGTKSVEEFLRDCREHGLDVISPEDINSSDWTSCVTDNVGNDGGGNSVGV